MIIAIKEIHYTLRMTALCGLVLRPRPHLGAYSAPQRPLAGIIGPLCGRKG